MECGTPRAWLASLEAGGPVDLPAFYLRGIADVPRGCHLARVGVDGTVSPAPYERIGVPRGRAG